MRVLRARRLIDASWSAISCAVVAVSICLRVTKKQWFSTATAPIVCCRVVSTFCAYIPACPLIDASNQQGRAICTADFYFYIACCYFLFFSMQIQFSHRRFNFFQRCCWSRRGRRLKFWLPESNTRNLVSTPRRQWRHPRSFVTPPIATQSNQEERQTGPPTYSYAPPPSQFKVTTLCERELVDW